MHDSAGLANDIVESLFELSPYVLNSELQALFICVIKYHKPHLVSESAIVTYRQYTRAKYVIHIIVRFRIMDPSSRRPWIVQKYGGTSIGKLLETITGIIVPNYLSTCRVAIVCSARSGTTKSLGTTSLLLEAIRCATSSETSTIELDKVIDTIRDEHIIAARNAIPQASSQDGPRILETLLEDIEGDCKMLRSFLKATWTVGEVTDRTKDRVLSVGEKLSCRVVSASLSAKVCQHPKSIV